MNKLAGIKAISFDADGTLWDFEKVMRHSLGYVLREMDKMDSLAASRLDIDKMIKIRNRVADELKGRVTNFEEVRLQSFKQTLADVGRPNDALASHLNQVYYEHRFEDTELFDDVLPTLEALKERYTIGLLSNGNSYPERCGLEGMFHYVVLSQDYGVEKPNPKIFQIAAEKAGGAKQQLLHVGDSLRDDIMGAINAGIQCVWLNRGGAENTSSLKIEYEIHSLAELLEIL